MTIDEAIKEQQEHLDRDYFVRNPRLREATKLGINALIFYRKLKSSNTGEIQGNFIGETEE